MKTSKGSLPRKDVESQGRKQLPKGATKGPDKPTRPKFKTGKSG